MSLFTRLFLYNILIIPWDERTASALCGDKWDRGGKKKKIQVWFLPGGHLGLDENAR